VTPTRVARPLALVLLALASQAYGQVKGPVTPAGCLALTASGRVEVQGRLSVRDFPGAPNFESVTAGDRPERTYLLTLAKPICIDDGAAGFADPSVGFDTVHVSVKTDRLWPQLRAGLNKIVVVTGEGFAAFDGHHHAPLVVLADQVRVVERP
jgi:hypothetical protein